MAGFGNEDSLVMTVDRDIEDVVAIRGTTNSAPRA